MPHIAAIVIIAAACILLYIFSDAFKDRHINKRLGIGLAFILIFQEISFQLWNISVGMWSIDYALPLQLCGISAILSAVMLITKSYSLYEVLYFWGIGGAAQAILTPEIGAYTYPHFRYFQFFLGHGAIIIASLFMTFVQGYRPRLISVWKALISLNIYAVLVGIFNYVTKSNYLFLCWKPEVSSIMDYIGPWPWYIIFLEIISLIIFYVLYMPFVIRDRFYRDSNKGNYMNLS